MTSLPFLHQLLEPSDIFMRMLDSRNAPRLDTLPQAGNTDYEIQYATR